MKYLRRRVRRAFLVEAVTFIVILVIAMTHPDLETRYGTGLYYGASVAAVVLALLYGMAWYTTRQPSPYRNNWAVCASGLSLICGVMMIWGVTHFEAGSLSFSTPGLLAVLTGGAGLFLYAPGGSPAKADANTAAPSESKKAFVPPPPSGRKPSSAPTAVAPSVAALRGSSPEVAAAVEPNAAWDPLMALRTAETLKKLRT
jgi:hypothetical protein